MVRNLLKITIRNFRKQLVFSVLNIFGLTIGMASFILIALWVMDELNYDRYQKKADQIYLLNKSYAVSGNLQFNNSTPAPLAPRLLDEFSEIKAAARVYEYRNNVVVKFQEKIFYDQVCAVDDDFIKLFTYTFIEGDINSALSDVNSVIISNRMAQKYFGKRNPLGEVLRIDNTKSYKVTGVFKNPPHNTSVKYEIITRLDDTKYRNNWYDHPYSTYILLSKNVDLLKLDKKMSELIQAEIPYQKIGIKSFRYSDIHLYTVNGENQRIQYVYLFSIIAVFILIIASINFMNLSTAKANRRSKEIGLRKVVGAHRKHIILQFLLESLIFSFVSVLLAMVLAELFKPLFNQLTNKILMINYSDPSLILGLLGIVIFTGLLAGSYPALFLSSFRPIVVLKGTFHMGSKGTLFRKVMVIVQFSTSIILIISTFIIYSQINFIKQKDLGFDQNNVIYLKSNKNINKRFNSFKNELLQISNIISVSRTSQLPSQMYDIRRGVTWEGIEDMNGSILGQCAVDYDYFETMKMSILEGRSFSREYGTDTLNYLLNQKAVEMIGWKNPIGKGFEIDEAQPGKIIGVVKDFNARPAIYGIEPMFFFFEPNWFRNIIIRVGTGNLNETNANIEQVFNKYSPDVPYNPNLLEDLIKNHYDSEQKVGDLASIFAIIVIIISCLGLFGLAAFTAEKKTKEIGIRKIFGASVTGVVFKLSSSFAQWVIISSIIAWVISYLVMSRWLDNFAYRISLSWEVFVLSGVLALIIAMLTVSYQTVKSAFKNPIDCLKYE